jgi:hypothetical protein
MTFRLAALVTAAVLGGFLLPVQARQYYAEQFDNVPAHTREFLSGQKRPDMKPWTGDWHHESCCGPADAYEADDVEWKDGQLFAIITEGDVRDDRYCASDDDAECKPFVPAGTRIPVPPGKIVIDSANPTGHGWIWLSSGRGPSVFCYVYPSLF